MSYEYNGHTVTYTVQNDGYDIFLDGILWITQREPYIPYRNKLSINEVKGYVGALSSFRSFTGLDLKEIERNSEIVEKYKEKLSNNSEEDDFIEGTDSVIIDDVLVIPVFIW